MTVKQAIAKLEKFPENLELVLIEPVYGDAESIRDLHLEKVEIFLGMNIGSGKCSFHKTLAVVIEK